MATMTPAQVAAFAYAAGVTDENDLVTAVAIPARESGYDPSKHRPPSAGDHTDDSWGLWQINILGGLSARLAELGLTAGDQLADPWNNARAMALLYKSSKFYAWGPYKGLSPTYGISTAQLQAAANGVAEAKSKGWLTPQFAAQIQSGNRMELGAGETPGANAELGSGEKSPIPDLSGIGDLISAIGRTVFNPEWWKWIGVGALGVLLLLIAVSQSKQGQQMISTGTKAATLAA
jgi:hypothetical protein